MTTVILIGYVIYFAEDEPFPAVSITFPAVCISWNINDMDNKFSFTYVTKWVVQRLNWGNWGSITGVDTNKQVPLCNTLEFQSNLRVSFLTQNLPQEGQLVTYWLLALSRV